MTPEETTDRLRELPSVPHSPPPHVEGMARAAFVRAFESAPWYAPVTTLVARASLPVVLTGIVVIYLSWTFSTAAMLMR
jgi:hypothetical protein